MRKEIILSNWLFHKGDIEVPKPVVKGQIYAQSKTERKLSGPAAYNYLDNPDPFYPAKIPHSDRWERVTIPHDYVVTQDLSKEENNALGYLHYDNAWYRNHFTLPDGSENKRITLRFDGVTGKSTVYLNGCLMYHNFSSYNTFEIDISDNVYYDKENIIAVYVNTEEWEGKDILVTVYNNCEELELFLNGESLGRKQIEKYGHGEWNVPYETGILEVKGYINGKLAATDKRITTGKPVALKLTLDNEFEANGRDIALFTCECIDETGNAVPDASEFVIFSVNAPAVIVGTGSDNCDHNNVTLPSRKMYMGKIRVAVKPAKNQKNLKLFAFSENYKSDVLEVAF